MINTLELSKIKLTLYVRIYEGYWLIRISLLRNQRHGLTAYIRTCYFTDQNIFSGKLEALDSQPRLEYVIWLIRTFLLGNQRHWTYRLYWNVPSSFDISSKKSEALDSHSMLECAKFIWNLFWKRHWTHILY
jgi:hypothetical protein